MKPVPGKVRLVSKATLGLGFFGQLIALSL